MKKDIMETAPPAKKVKNPTMFEVDDKGRDYEYGRGYRYSPDTYTAPFILFVESLGFDVKQGEHGGSDVEINGVRFHVDTSKASYKSKNAYTRKVEVRKPENRYIRLYAKVRGAEYGIKIHFNKEYSADTLRKKINAGIDASKSADLEHQKFKDTENENTVAVGRHLAQDPFVAGHIKRIYINRGTINLSSNTNGWYIELDNSGKQTFGLNSSYADSVKALKVLSERAQADIQNLMFVAQRIVKLPKLPPELAEWAKNTYGKYYSVKADNASN